MTTLTATIDGIHGCVKVAISDNDTTVDLELKWCASDEDESCGFLTSLVTNPIIVTEIAAEHFIKMLVRHLAHKFQCGPGCIFIINDMGEHIPDVEFLPPTFSGNEADISMFVAQQNSLQRIYLLYMESGILDSYVVESAMAEGVLDDFLSLVHIQASGVFSQLVNQVNKESSNGSR